MTVFNLEHFPNVCRLCLKPESSRLHSLDDNFEGIRMQIKTFLEDLIYPLPEDKAADLPGSVCGACLKQLTDFAVYRNKLVLTHRFMEALVDLKHANAKPLTALFTDSKDALDALFKDLELCTKSEPQIDDLLQEFGSYSFMNMPVAHRMNVPVKVEIREDSFQDDFDYECLPEADSDRDSDSETKPDMNLSKASSSKVQSDDASSSDDEPLAKKKRKQPKKPPKKQPKKEPKEAAKPKPVKAVAKKENGGPKKMGRPRIHEAGRHLTEPWSCDQCKFTTIYRVAVNRHKEVHERRKTRTFPCSICGMEFKTKPEMKSHVLIHPEYQIMCEICGTSLKSSTAMKIHMERHENKRKYNCQYCDYAGYALIYLKAHMKNHTNELNKKCEICGAVFKKSGHLKRHMEGHSNERKYACEHCPSRYNTSNALKNHHQRVHLGIRHPCDYCDKTFEQRILLRNHMELIHQIQCNFICDICVAIFDSQERLDTHRQRHENPKPLECRVCLTLFPTQEAVDEHGCITYREDYYCCNKDLRNHNQYNRHMFIKHGLKTNARVKPIPGVLLGTLRKARKRLEQCRKCDIAFPSKALKLQHMAQCHPPEPTSKVEFPNVEDSVGQNLSLWGDNKNMMHQPELGI